MNSWPQASDYSKMLQNPQVAFREANLRKSRVHKDAKGQPIVCAGAFAVVYKATLEDSRDVAVRAFTSQRSGLDQRYNVVSEYLDQQKVRCLVWVRYLDKGILLPNGKRYPLVAMDWVAGETLYLWLRKRCQARDTAALGQLADRWIDLIDQLAAARIAHGDLQHDNVLVTARGELKLVDYDCMSVPALEGQPNPEKGLLPYQHPGRSDNTPLSPRLDDFSALFIYVALRALAAQPRLWDQFIQGDGGQPYDRLLIRSSDLDRPGESALFQALLASPDSQVGRLARTLCEAYRAPLGATPPLRDAIYSFDAFRSLISQRQWDEAVALLSRRASRNSEPPDLAPKIDEAKRRVGHRSEMERLAAAGDDDSLIRACRGELLADYPAAAPLLETVHKAKEAARALEELSQAESRQAWRDYVEIYQRHQAALEARPRARGAVELAKQWKTRNEACDEVMRLLEAPTADAPALQQAKARLAKLGGHPDVDRRAADLEKLQARKALWGVIHKGLAMLTAEADWHLHKHWSESLLGGWEVAEAHRDRLEAGRRRLGLVKQIAQLKSGCEDSPSLDAERRIVELADKLPEGYTYPQLDRVRLARQRAAAYEEFESALREPISDRALAAAWKGLALCDAQGLTQPAARSRAETAVRRAAKLADLEALPPDLPVEKRDQRLMELWDDALLRDCEDARPWRRHREEALARRKALEQLMRAMASQDYHQALELAQDPVFREAGLPSQAAAQMEIAHRRLEESREVLEAVRTGNVEQFLKLFDAQAFRQNAALFANHMRQIVPFVRQHALSAENLGLRPARGRASVAYDARGCWVRWVWPARRYTERCLVAICREEPQWGDDPLQLETAWRTEAAHSAYERGGGLLVPPAVAQGTGLVVVWAIVELGAETLYSEPLALGRLEEAPGRKRK